MTKLPVLATVATAYRLTWTHFGYLVRISVAWGAVAAICLFIGYFMLGGVSGSALESIADMSAAQTVTITVLLLVGWLLDIVMGAIVAVAAHRAFLLGETHDGYHAALDGRTRRFIWRTMIVGGIVGLASIVVQLGSLAAFSLGLTVLFLTVIAMVALALVLLGRLAPYLPAAAFDDPAVTLREAFRLTSGNGWRIAVAFTLAMTPVLLAQTLLQFAAETWLSLAPLSGTILTVLVIWIGGVSAAAIAAGVLSQVYQAVRGDPATVVSVPG